MPLLLVLRRGLPARLLRLPPALPIPDGPAPAHDYAAAAALDRAHAHTAGIAPVVAPVRRLRVLRLWWLPRRLMRRMMRLRLRL